MDPCYQDKDQNKLSNCKKYPDICSNENECCIRTENLPVNIEASYGTCVTKGTCNPKTGFCHSKKKQRGNPTVRERFSVHTREGYSDTNDCKNWEWAFYAMTIIVFALIVFIVIQRRNN